MKKSQLYLIFILTMLPFIADPLTNNPPILNFEPEKNVPLSNAFQTINEKNNTIYPAAFLTDPVKVHRRGKSGPNRITYGRRDVKVERKRGEISQVRQRPTSFGRSDRDVKYERKFGAYQKPTGSAGSKQLKVDKNYRKRANMLKNK